MTNRNFPVGNTILGMQFSCMSNNVYGVCASHALLEDVLPAGSPAGESAIIDDRGRVLKQAFTASENETTLEERLHIASFRRRHAIPRLRQELYAPVYEEYIGKNPPNTYTEHLPGDSADGRRSAGEKARW